MEHTGEIVLCEAVGPVTVITLNRPEKRNAVDGRMASALREVMDRFEADPAARVAMLTAAGDKAFCAGMDLAAFAAGEGADILKGPGGFAGLTSRKRRKPLLVAVNGAALGGGMEIVLACDLVVAAENAVFGLPEVWRGLFAAAGGAFRLPQAIPRARAMEMLLTGQTIPADEALALGLINRVVPFAALRAEALDLANKVAANAPLAVAETLALATAATSGDATRLEALNAEAWERVRTSSDAAEGAQAFTEKRQPRWKGR